MTFVLILAACIATALIPDIIVGTYRIMRK